MNFLHKQQGSTFSRTIIGSGSCYITVNRFAFLSVGTIFARRIHISNNILNSLWTLFKKLNPLKKRKETGICLIFKNNLAHLAHRRALRTLTIASAERLKSLFVQANNTWTLWIRKRHVSIESIRAIIIPTIRGECATLRDCSHLFHTCLQRNIGSCSDGEFHGLTISVRTTWLPFSSNILMASTQELLFLTRNGKRICPFGCSKISL